MPDRGKDQSEDRASSQISSVIRRPWPDVVRALRHRNFRLFAMGQIISLIGTWMQSVAQSWLVYRLTRSELLLGTTWFFSQAPVFFLGALGGLVADRYSRHRIVVVTQILSTIPAFTMAALIYTDKVQVWHIFIAAGFLGIVNAFDMPARQSLLIALAGREDLLNAISLNSAMFNAARVLGPAAAGVLVAKLGEEACFLLNGLSFIAVIRCLLAIKLKEARQKAPVSPWAHFVDGFRYLRSNPAVKTLLTLIGTASIASMPALVLMPFFADDIFHRGSQGLGFLMGGMGIGAVIGTLGLARRSETSGLPSVIFSGSLLLGFSFIMFSLSASYYMALAVMPLVGFGVMRQNASANTLIQTLIPDEYRGRIMALYSMMVVGLGPFGSLAAGAMAERAGARATVMTGGLLCLSAAIVFRMRWRLLRALAIGLAVLVLGGTAAVAAQTGSGAPDSDSQEAIQEATRELSKISGLSHRRDIPQKTISREEVKRFLEQRVKENIKPEEIRVEELALKKFGFVPADFDLRRTTVDLLTEQAAAFYDFETKTLFLVQDGSDRVQFSALVHELAHALADQHFNLRKFMEEGSDDASLARMAVMEGQATWLMSEYLTARTGQSLLDSPVLVRMMSRSAELSSGDFPVFEGVPLYLRETLLFPYTAGMLFQHAVIEKMGKPGFTQVFRRPPVSTQEILHPEMYLAGVKPRSLKPPSPPSTRGYRSVISGSVGELDHSILLRQYVGKEEAEAAAPRWRGGNYAIWERKDRRGAILAYASEWEDRVAAQRFLSLYRRVLAGKWKTMEVSSDTAAQVCGRGDDGYFLLVLDGTRVTSLEGLPSQACPAGKARSSTMR